jgi:type IV secretion system protein VirD4
MSVHGSARFATREDMQAAGLLFSTDTMHMPRGLFLGFWYRDEDMFEPIRYGGDLNQLIVGGVGGGKFTTAIAPMLLASPQNTFVVVDPKGEVAELLGPYFEMPYSTRRNVYLLDPWDECKTGQTSVLNVLTGINSDNPNYVDDARALADAMVMPSGGENTHWDNAARNFLTAILLYVALHPKEDGRRDLIRVRQIVTMTWAMPSAYVGPKRETLSALLFELRDSDLGGEAVKNGCNGMLNREDKERSNIISSIDRDTAWIDSPQMARVLRGDGLDLREAALEPNKYFIVLPPDFFMTHRGWLRLTVTAFAKAFRRNKPAKDKPQHERWRHIVIDEFANLGEMPFILNDVAISRGFDVKYTLVVQGLSQLESTYGNAWQSFINNSFQRFFAVSDMMTAKYVSDMLGETTVVSEGQSQGTSGSDGWSSSEGSTAGDSVSVPISGTGGASQTYSGSQSTSRGRSGSKGWSQGRSQTLVQRSLMTPDEVRRLPERDQLLFVRGQYPIISWRPPYWEAFPGWRLPPFRLGQIWATHGSEDDDDPLFERWMEWRDAISLLPPKFRTARLTGEALALSPPAPRTEWPQWFIKGSFAAFVMMALLSWFWPNPPHP